MNLNNRRIIINNDFDGCLSASVLVTLYNCRVVGFSNSKDKVWIVDNEKLDGNELYVDMFTLHCDSVDQHMHPFYFKRNLSPNGERGRYTFNCYSKKYPFSTFVWLLCYAAREGKSIDKFIPFLSMGDGVFTKKDVILRADDILLNCLKYHWNCNEWIEFLCEYSNNNKSIVDLFSFLKKQNRKDVEKWKANIDLFFSKKYGFLREEIPDIDTEMSKKFLKRFGIEYEKVTKVINFIHKRCKINSKEEFDEFYAKNKEQLFSFAFVFSPSTTDKLNFSYSLYNGTAN